ncbi:MAG: glycosyltransferase family 4 protein [Kovacikia sp.]
MKVAIACTGLDHIHRGFESFSAELYESLQSNSDVYLLKASGVSAPNIRTLPTLKRTSKIYRMFPLNQIRDFYRYRNECYTFGCALLPALLQGKYNLIHFSDWLLGDFLLAARQRLSLKFKLLLSNGAPYDPSYCHRYDGVHQVALSHYEAGIAAGIPPQKSFLVPYGFDRQRLVKPESFNPTEFRQRYKIPADAFVVVSLAALNSTHKRIDWLIKEFSNLDPQRFYLVMAGQREEETPELEHLAEHTLARGSYQFLTLPYSEVPALLWASNLMVLCSLQEGFGRVICEAMGARAPLLLHPHATAKWLVDCPDCFVDMTNPGHLSSQIAAIDHQPEQQSLMIQKNLQAFEHNYDWRVLAKSYLSMYETVFYAD